MKRHLTPGQSRFLAILLLVAVVALLVGAIAWPTWWLHERYDTYLENYSDQLARYRRVAALRPDIEAAISAVKGRDAGKYHLRGATPALAAAELQGLVTKIVETHKGRVVSSQALALPEETKESGPTKVAITLQMNASIIPFQMILHALESGEPYLFIDQMTIRSPQQRNYKPVPGVQPEFSVQLNVHGFTNPAGPTK